MRNPFEFGRALEADELIDRQVELETLTKQLVGARRYFLIGPRRFGKTSLLLAAAARATEAGVPTIVVNAESFTSLEALAGGIAGRASSLIKASLKEQILNVVKWFSLLKPQAEYDALTDAIKVSVAPREMEPAARSVADALDSLNELARSEGIKIGVVIDEFQSVSLKEGIEAEQILRAVIQHHRHLGYIFSGSDTRMMMAMISEHGRPFYRQGDSQYLGPVPREEFGEFIRTSFASRGQAIEPDALVEVFESSEDVPYNVQKLCAYLWDLPAGEPAADLSVSEVHLALATLLRASHVNYLALYHTLTSSQQKVIYGMARRRQRSETDTAAAKRAGVAPSTFRTAKNSFLQIELIREDFSDGKTKNYAFVDPFFAAWIRGFIEG